MFCPRCEHRSARYVRQCERAAHGEHLWRVMQAEMQRHNPSANAPHLAWERQPGDVQRMYIEGARAMREMAR